MVLVWTVRLGGFLFYRALVMGGDSRFEEAKQSFSSFFVYWSVQALWAWICSLPVTLVNSHERNPGLHWSDVVGVVLFVFGFLMESTADFQKFAFKRNPENKGKFVTVGLWKYARYPQYFAEIVLWWGIFVAAAHDLRNWEFVAVASPLFVMYLLLVLSGIPVQEKQAKQRWGSNPARRRGRSRRSCDGENGTGPEVSGTLPMPRFGMDGSPEDDLPCTGHWRHWLGQLQLWKGPKGGSAIQECARRRGKEQGCLGRCVAIHWWMV